MRGTTICRGRFFTILKKKIARCFFPSLGLSLSSRKMVPSYSFIWCRKLEKHLLRTKNHNSIPPRAIKKLHKDNRHIRAHEIYRCLPHVFLEAAVIYYDDENKFMKKIALPYFCTLSHCYDDIINPIQLPNSL